MKRRLLAEEQAVAATRAQIAQAEADLPGKVEAARQRGGPIEAEDFERLRLLQRMRATVARAGA